MFASMASPINAPAAFGRLCVETPNQGGAYPISFQPPSGGCVLKLATFKGEKGERGQPPSGGCVLKQTGLPWILAVGAAAFGRLCVET